MIFLKNEIILENNEKESWVISFNFLHFPIHLSLVLSHNYSSFNVKAEGVIFTLKYRGIYVSFLPAQSWKKPPVHKDPNQFFGPGT